MACIYAPADSWQLRRAGSTALLVSPRDSEEGRGTPSDGLPRTRGTQSVILGAEGGGQAPGSQRRRVEFSPSFLNGARAATPYSSQYGVHPSFFNFDRGGAMRLTDSGIAENMRRKEQGLDPLMLDGAEAF